jgi:hypothetical protein
VDPAGRFASVGAARWTKAGAKGGVFAFAPTWACWDGRSGALVAGSGDPRLGATSVVSTMVGWLGCPGPWVLCLHGWIRDPLGWGKRSMVASARVDVNSQQ